MFRRRKRDDYFDTPPGSKSPEISVSNAASIAQRNLFKKRGLSPEEAVREHHHLKHKYPFFGIVDCYLSDLRFQLFTANDCLMSWQHFWLGAVEPEVISAWMSFDHKDGVAIDAGAYVGYFSILAALSGARAVHAFEAMPRTAERAKINMRLNGLKQVVINAKGLSDSERMVEFNMPRGADLLGTGNSIDLKEGVEVVDTAVAHVIALDSYWKTLGCPHVRNMKIDVEEHEFEALFGMMELLEACRPKLLIELSQRKREEVTSLLDALGYRLEQVKGRDFIAYT